jgi:hypothetical protein
MSSFSQTLVEPPELDRLVQIDAKLITKLLVFYRKVTIQWIIDRLDRAFNFLDLVIIVGNESTTPRKLLALPGLRDFPAESLPIKFFGGPPSNRRYYSGTLATLLVDLLLLAWYNNNIPNLLRYEIFTASLATNSQSLVGSDSQGCFYHL